MHALKWIVLTLAVLQGLWLTFDGSRSLILGDYVTFSSGQSAGQLGPWSHVVRALGFEPRSALIKSLHVLLGVAWLASSTLYQLRPAAGSWALLACAVASLWYLPIGTLMSIAIIVLLVTSG